MKEKKSFEGSSLRESISEMKVEMEESEVKNNENELLGLWAPPEDYIYVLEIYQGRSLPRMGQGLELPNVYVKVQFVTCKSGNSYRTDIVYQNCEPLFHSKFLELSEQSDIKQILLTICHRNTSSHLPDDVIGYVPISVQNFTEYDEFIWIPIVSSAATTSSVGMNAGEAERYAGYLQIRLGMISLDEAIFQQEKKLHTRYSHIL
ncbi:hypothetical protein RFI_24315, partial [Reticulomyxa filosa]